VTNNNGKLSVSISGGTTSVVNFKELCAAGKNVQDYWALPPSGASGGYETALLGPVRAKFENIKLPGDRISALADAIRIYTEQVNNDSSSRATMVQSIQQMAEQDISTASNLQKSIQKNAMEAVGNIH
jgi:hypothetical protein